MVIACGRFINELDENRLYWQFLAHITAVMGRAGLASCVNISPPSVSAGVAVLSLSLSPCCVRESRWSVGAVSSRKLHSLQAGVWGEIIESEQNRDRGAG